MFQFNATQCATISNLGAEIEIDGSRTTLVLPSGHQVRVTAVATTEDSNGFHWATGETYGYNFPQGVNGYQTKTAFLVFEDSGPLGWLPLIGAPVEGATDAERFALAAIASLEAAAQNVDDDDDDDDDEPRSLWDDESDLYDFGIDVPAFVTFEGSPGGIFSPSPYDVATIIQGGCASGAWMPAVTYHTALRNMTENGDEILQYIEDSDGALPDVTGQSWGNMACTYVSTAVEIWACRVASELHNNHGFREE